jgi:hypothetical protein
MGIGSGNPAGLSAKNIVTEGGIGRSAPPEAAELSDALRRGRHEFLANRRRAALFTLVHAASLGVVAAYQFGLIKRVPEPPLPFLDADRVDASAEAYALGRTPDAAIGVLSAGLSLVLLGRGTAVRSPWLGLATAAKAAGDAAGALLLTAEQGTRHRRFCSWCLMAAGASVATLPAVLPEALDALRRLRDR